MDDILYEVRITSLQLSRFTPDQIHVAFAELFCLSVPEARQRLGSLPLLVRGSLTLEQAGKYQRVLSRAGMACEVSPQSTVSPVAADAVALQAPPGAAPVGEQA